MFFFFNSAKRTSAKYRRKRPKNNGIEGKSGNYSFYIQVTVLFYKVTSLNNILLNAV